MKQKNSLYENEVDFRCHDTPTYDILKENEYDLPTTIKLEAKPLQLQNTKLEAEAFAKMDSIFFPDLTVPFDLEDILPDDPWINNTELPVQNLESVTAQEVLEETILSPAKNVLGSMEELNFFAEEFTNLAVLESNINSPSINSNIIVMSQDFDGLLANAKLEDAYQNDCEIQSAAILDGLKSEPAPQYNIIPAPQHNIIPAPTNECETTAVVPNVVTELPLSVPHSPTTPIDSIVFGTSVPIDVEQLDPEIAALLENLEKCDEGNMGPSCTKQPRKRSNTNLEAPTCKKKKLHSCSSTDNEPIFDKVVERRIKNNAASRVCRASRKARHQDLFRQEKELLAENKELSIQVEQLAATVDYLRSYLVNRLSGQC